MKDDVPIGKVVGVDDDELKLIQYSGWSVADILQRRKDKREGTMRPTPSQMGESVNDKPADYKPAHPAPYSCEGVSDGCTISGFACGQEYKAALKTKTHFFRKDTCRICEHSRSFLASYGLLDDCHGVKKVHDSTCMRSTKTCWPFGPWRG
jgi:hypothetical protein